MTNEKVSLPARLAERISEETDNPREFVIGAVRIRLAMINDDEVLDGISDEHNP